MRTRGIVLTLTVLVVGAFAFVARPASSANAPQTYRTTTACDDAWQEGPFTGTHSGIKPSDDYKWAWSPVGWDGQGHTFNPAFRFPNVQVAPHETVGTATITLGVFNNFAGIVSQLDVPVQVEAGDAADICWTNDIIHRTFTPAVEWNTVVTGDTATFDVTGMVQQAVDAPGWRKGGSVLVRLVGEDAREEYPHSYGWNVLNYDCHCDLAPTLTLAVK